MLCNAEPTMCAFLRLALTDFLFYLLARFSLQLRKLVNTSQTSPNRADFGMSGTKFVQALQKGVAEEGWMPLLASGEKHTSYWASCLACCWNIC